MMKWNGRRRRTVRGHTPEIAALAAVLVVGAGNGFATPGGTPSRETRTLAGERISLSVSLEETDGGARFVLDSLTDPVTGTVLDTSSSPIWQVMLAGPDTPPPGTPFPAAGEIAGGSVVVPAGHAGWGSSGPDALVLRWTGLETPGGQTLDVQVSIRLPDPSGPTEWSMTARLSDGSRMIVSTAFPLLDLPGIGGDSSDDTLLHPALGGSLIRDPVGCGESLPEFDPTTGDPNSLLLYPGETLSQFMTLYDDTLGLYLAAHDPAGAVKGLAYSVSGGHIRLWVRNINTVEWNEDRRAMADALRTLDLETLGYPVVAAFHHGDWMDAATLYRQWAIGADVPFLSHGFVSRRTDIGERVRNTVLLIRYSFGFFDSNPVNPERDRERLAAAIDFFRENEPDLGIAVALVGVIAGVEYADIPRESWYGSHGRPELDGDLKDGVSGIVDWLWQRYGIPAGHNRDTGNWLVQEGTTENAIYEREDALHRAIVRRWDGTPHRKPWSDVQRSVCTGSEWQMARRLAIRRATVLDSRGPGGEGPGFQFLIVSGQGSVPKTCYAPLLGDNPSGDHRHPIGGGSWWNDRLAGYVASLRDLYGAQAPCYTVIPEREHERLIGIPGLGVLGGKGRQYPFSDDTVTQPGGGWLPCSEPVPLSMALYHDHVLQGTQGVYLSDYIDAFGAAYGAGGTLVPHPNYYRAMATLSGRMLSLLLRSDRLGAQEDASVDGPFPSGLCPAALEDRAFMRLLVETRRHNLRYLGWGRMLRFPRVETDILPLEVYRNGQLRTEPVKAVLASAFQARDGTVRIFVANPTREAREWTLSFDPAWYGIAPDACRRLDRLGPDGAVTPLGLVCGDAVWTSPPLSADPLSVEVFSLARPTPRPHRPSGRSPGPGPGRSEAGTGRRGP